MTAAYWEPGTQYNLNDVVQYEGHRYKIIQPHRSQGDWTPPVTPALWGRMSDQDNNCNNDDKHHQNQGYQPQQPVQQPYQQQQPQQQPPQYGQHQQDHHADQNKHDDDGLKKKLEIGAGLLGGAALLGGGLFAYKKHKEHDEDDKAEAWARTNWINEARARTEAYRQNGSQEPYTWVLTHGKSIPQGAILVGKEKSWNLYICRAFEDGGIQIGKASDAFKKGGVIGYKNEEIHVEEYEVLCGDMNRLRWVPVSGRLNVASLGYRPIDGGRESGGARLYVAQAPHKEAVHPGKACENWDGAFIPYDGKEKLIKEYQVLCYNH